MKAQNPFFDRLSRLHNLPTLPHILLRLFDACGKENINFDEIAAIVGKDPALCAKLLKLVNSAYFGLRQKVREIQQAVALIGTSGLKNMAICACVYEAFPKPKKAGRFPLKAFWWHSIRCAILSQHIANELKIDQTDDAFISGLLHDIGKLVLWSHCGMDYEALFNECQGDRSCLVTGEARLGATHSEVGAWLLNRWKFYTVVADSVRYHHEPAARIAQALPTTQVVHVSNLLCHDDEETVAEGFKLAHKILGLGEQACRVFIDKIVAEGKEVADALGIDIQSDTPASVPHADETSDEKDRKIRDNLVQDVQNVSLLVGSLEGFLAAGSRSDILSVMSDGLKILLDLDRFLFFLFDGKKRALFGYSRNKEGGFSRLSSLSISMDLGDSLLVRSLAETKFVSSFEQAEESGLTILDEQIIRLTGGDGVYCLPMHTNEDMVGVLVLSIGKGDLPHIEENRKLLRIFIHKGALALRLDQLKRDQLQDVREKRVDASADMARRVVHEVNNPLSIIKNYLKILQLKLSDINIAQEELQIINEEINRVSLLLNKLTVISSEKPSDYESTNVNELISDIVKLTRDSLLRHSHVTLHTDLQPDLPQVAAENAGLKQVFINLMKNAAEAMASGGNLTIQTRSIPSPIGSRPQIENRGRTGYVEVIVKDDGPGIPDDIKEKLFDPYVSSKADGHSGLGLSIVYNIIKTFHGKITCESEDGSGTTFIIELPVK